MAFRRVSIWPISVVWRSMPAQMAMVISRLNAAQQGMRSSCRPSTPSTQQAAKVRNSMVFSENRL